MLRPASPVSTRLTSFVVIPARLASTRLPRKLLLRETGKTLIQHTYEAACRAILPAGVCIAADHEEIAIEARRFGGDVRMTSPEAPSGTDRIAEVARDGSFDGVDVVVNVQGDEPELAGEAIDLVVRLMDENPEAPMATLATPIRTKEQLHDPSCVKVVFDQSLRGANQFQTAGRALYFSRSPIPHAREWRDELLMDNPPHLFQHIGLYAYRREFLLQLATMPRTPLEKLENLEQLRVLESGKSIIVGVIDEPTIGIDTPADYAAFVERTKTRNR